MRFGLGARLAVIFAVLVAFTALLTSAASVVSTSNEANDDIDRFLRDRANEIADGSRQGPGERGRQGSDITAVDADSEVQTLDGRGEITATLGVTLPVSPGDIELADKRGPAVYRTVTIDGSDYRMITIHNDGGGAVQVARSLDGTNALLDEIRSRLLLLGLALSAVAGGIGWLIARRTTKPLRTLTSSVEQVATTGDLSTPIALDRRDEIGRLASSFDEMLAALAVSRDQQHQLVQDAAHELRTPLTSISANVEMLERAPDLDDDMRREVITATRSELGQLRNLFTEIIELATDAHDAAPHGPVDLAAVVDEAVRTFGVRSARPIEVTSTESVIDGDTVALERAVGNLLSNADKYSPDDAVVTVTVGAGTVAVRDRGPGIPVDQQARVFDRFYRSDAARSQPGSGLGLAIVKKIVTDHGGRPWIRDAPGGGTEVGFTLPLR